MVAMAPHPMQYASLAYFTLPSEYFTKELHVRYESRIRMLAVALKQVGFEVVIPQGSYYLFAAYRGVSQLKDLAPMDASMYMIREVGVAVVPGDNFYGKSSDGDNYLRFAACRSLSDITTAIEKLKTKLGASENR
jgi:aspartate/methionine/tyrosine aminotransferase